MVGMCLLAKGSSQVMGGAQDPLHAQKTFLLDHGMKLRRRPGRSYQSPDMFPETPKSLVVRKEYECLGVPDEFAPHFEPGSIRVSGSILVEVIHDLGGVDDDKRLAEKLD